MATRIHSTAIIEAGAQLDDGVEVGAYAFIGSNVRLGSGTEVRHHATVEGYTTIGEGNLIHSYAFIGGLTQDLKYRGGKPGLVIGNNNTFREFCTVHVATADGDSTRIGSNNHFLAYTHIAHDCVIGSSNIFSNNATLAGHVNVGDHVVLGGLTAIHQFCRIGSFAMTGGLAKVVQDIPPYMMADGAPAQVRTINKVGLERNGLGEKTGLVRTIFKTFYRMGLNHSQAIQKLREHPEVEDPLLDGFLKFVENSERGFC